MRGLGGVATGGNRFYLVFFGGFFLPREEGVEGFGRLRVGRLDLDKRHVLCCS